MVEVKLKILRCVVGGWLGGGRAMVFVFNGGRFEAFRLMSVGTMAEVDKAVAAAKAAPTAKVEASEAKAREVKTADAGGAPVLAPIISDANTILCQKCGRTNRIDARRCACGAAL